MQFDEKLSKMQSALEETKDKKKALDETLTEIYAKLEGLQVDKEAFKEIEQVEMEKKAYQRMLLMNKLESHKAKIS